MILHTVVVSFQRLELLKRTIHSYRETVSVPHNLLVVDNGSDDDVIEWLNDNLSNRNVIYLGENRYPGFACNHGFATAKPETTHLHRSDSDMLYLPGWCDNAQEAFAKCKNVALVGLRTAEEELNTQLNTGGTALIRRDVWDQGLRYDESPWVDDMTEDWKLCKDIELMGYQWARVSEPSVRHLADHDLSHPYYRHSFGVRGLLDRYMKGEA